MGKLQLMILFFLITSLFLHVKNFKKDRSYIKSLFAGKEGSEKRIRYLDYIRLLATLLVILVHCVDSSTAEMEREGSGYLAIQSVISILLVCNNLFIMNSGALILNRTEGSLLQFYYKRFTQVAIPFVCYYFIYILLSTRYFNSGLFSGLMMALKDMAAGPIDWAPHLWVIYVILSLYLLAPFFSILLKNLPDGLLHGLAAIILLMGCVSLYLPVFGLPIDLSLMISPWLGVFLLGYYFAHPASLPKRHQFYVLGAVSLAGTVLVTFIRSDYEAILQADGAPMMTLLGGSIFLLLRSLENKLPSPGRIMKFLIRYSYSILMVHWAVLYVVRDLIGITDNIPLAFFLVLSLSAVSAFVYDQTVVFLVQRLFKRN